MSNADALLFGIIMIISLGLTLILGIIFEKKNANKRVIQSRKTEE